MKDTIRLGAIFCAALVLGAAFASPVLAEDLDFSEEVTKTLTAEKGATPILAVRLSEGCVFAPDREVYEHEFETGLVKVTAPPSAVWRFIEGDAANCLGMAQVPAESEPISTKAEPGANDPESECADPGDAACPCRLWDLEDPDFCLIYDHNGRHCIYQSTVCIGPLKCQVYDCGEDAPLEFRNCYTSGLCS